MSRTIVFGNSHVGAFKLGAGQIAAPAGDEIAFFGVPHPNFNLLRLDEALTLAMPEDALANDPVSAGKIAKINDGATSVALREADTVVWAGYAMPYLPLVQIAVGFDVDGLREVGAPRALSRAAFDAACDGMIEAQLPRPVWRGWATPRLLLLPVAVPGEAIATSADPKHAPWRLLHRRPEGFPGIVAVYMDRLEAALRRLNIGLIRQPSETLLASGFTDQRYCRGSTRLSGVEHPSNDFIHMNAEYGALFMKALTAQLQPA